MPGGIGGSDPFDLTGIPAIFPGDPGLPTGMPVVPYITGGAAPWTPKIYTGGNQGEPDPPTGMPVPPPYFSGGDFPLHGKQYIPPPPPAGSNKAGLQFGVNAMRTRAPYDLHASDGLGAHEINVRGFPGGGAEFATFTANASHLKTLFPVVIEGLATAGGQPYVQSQLYAVPSSRVTPNTPTHLAANDIAAVRSIGGVLYLPYGGDWYIWYGGSAGQTAYCAIHDARDPLFALALMSRGGEHNLQTGGNDTVIGAGVAVTVLQANRWRYMAIISNTGANSARVCTSGEVATATNGLFLAAAGGSFTISGPNKLLGSISIFSAAGTTISAKDYV